MFGVEPLIPWTVVACSIILVLTGLVLGLHGIGQRNPSRVASVGWWLIGCSLAVGIITIAVNAGGSIVAVLNHSARDVGSHLRGEDPDAPR